MARRHGAARRPQYFRPADLQCPRQADRREQQSHPRLARAKPGAGEARSRAGSARTQETVLARRACDPGNFRRHSRGRTGCHRSRLWPACPRPRFSHGPRSLHRGGHQSRTCRCQCQDRRCHPDAGARRAGRAVPSAQYPPGRCKRRDPRPSAARGHRHERKCASFRAARAGKRRFHRSAAPPDARGRPGPVAQLLACRSEWRRTGAPGRLTASGRAGGRNAHSGIGDRQASSRASGRRTGPRRDADSRGSLRARAKRRQLLSHALRRSECARRAHSRRYADVMASARLLRRSRTP